MIKEAMLWAPLKGGKVACALCSHRCVIAPSKSGICAVRENHGGKLVTLVYGEVIAVHVDPIEKKPLYHFYPGSKALSIAAAGCNFRCSFCQNWEISQAPRREGGALRGQKLSPEEIVREAGEQDCRSISYTYTEPTIFFEYAYDTARLAREAGLANNFVTNGYMTEEALAAIRPYLDAANVDLKAFKDETYRKVCGARLEPVLETIRRMKALGIWVEVTTMVVPGMNDGEEELTGIARFIAGVDPDIPWHISRFHPDFEYTDAPPTPVETLRAAYEIGRTAGLRYLYVGNFQGESEDTHCPTCGRVLVRRRGFFVAENKLAGNVCPFCAGPIAGVFR
jgi:pyruvate formate lyase activating enzyme